jgi:hypothetical protein
LLFIVAARKSSYGIATTHPFALNAQGRLQAETLDAINLEKIVAK